MGVSLVYSGLEPTMSFPGAEVAVCPAAATSYSTCVSRRVCHMCVSGVYAYVRKCGHVSCVCGVAVTKQQGRMSNMNVAAARHVRQAHTCRHAYRHVCRNVCCVDARLAWVLRTTGKLSSRRSKRAPPHVCSRSLGMLLAMGRSDGAIYGRSDVWRRYLWQK